MAQVIHLALLNRTSCSQCQHFEFLDCPSVIMAAWPAGWLAGYLSSQPLNSMKRGHFWEAHNSSDSHGVCRFTIMFTTVHHLSLSWARLIESTSFDPVFIRHILILSSHLCMVFHVITLLQASSPKPHNYFCSTYMLHVLPTSSFFK